MCQIANHHLRPHLLHDLPCLLVVISFREEEETIPEHACGLTAVFNCSAESEGVSFVNDWSRSGSLQPLRRAHGMSQRLRSIYHFYSCGRREPIRPEVARTPGKRNTIMMRHPTALRAQAPDNVLQTMRQRLSSDPHHCPSEESECGLGSLGDSETVQSSHVPVA